jgi:hypothetical protein
MPFQVPRDDILRSVRSCRKSSYDPNISHNFNNISIISQGNHAVNETIAGCSGFTKQQIMRLLSTKKSSSSKKFKYRSERPLINVKKGGLFNDSTISNDSNGLFRSHSSPNLLENREKKCFGKGGRRKLSVMKEDTPTLLEVSGIVALENCNTPDSGILKLEDSVKAIDAAILPVIAITPESDRKVNNVFINFEVDLDKEIGKECSETKSELARKSMETNEVKTETPKMNTQIVKRTSSLEKIINRFKKVRATVISDNKDMENDFNIIVEEKENMNTVCVDVFTANKNLLPDLLSPSVTLKPTDYLDQICMDLDELESRKPRQSLGTALGVDKTFLDQFHLID